MLLVHSLSVATAPPAGPPGNLLARRKFTHERRIIHLINPDATGLGGTILRL